MLYRDYPEQECSLARALEVIGERWSLLIVRDVFAGIRRYEDLHRSLDIARNILQTRLNRLCLRGEALRVLPDQEGPCSLGSYDGAASLGR
jgi:DNA-binding HxlR family transcriptional regulator